MAPERDWDRRIGARLKLRDLHILSAVVRWGSMAGAAKRLQLSQPAVSEAVSNLEAALRVPLLDRTPRGVAPTLYASALLKREHAVFDELRRAVKEIEFLANPAAGEVRVAVAEVLAAGLIPDVIDRLSKRYPQIYIHAILANPSTLEFRELRDRSVDLLVARVPERRLEDDIQVDVFLNDPHFVVAGTRNPWARRSKISLADLMEEPWVFPQGQVVREVIASAFRAHGLPPPREQVTSGTLHMLNHLLATGRFLTITPRSVLRYNARQWSVKALPIDLRTKATPHAVVTLRNRTLSPAAKLFVRELKAAASRM
ncbi:MAG TPA: LysR family transcriptional regulator [Pseudolabrys sp.]|nr:LysR family transcriptional regulator [Pseudolabrys sp.]